MLAHCLRLAFAPQTSWRDSNISTQALLSTLAKKNPLPCSGFCFCSSSESEADLCAQADRFYRVAFGIAAR
ncbi:MAG: hypothetical protein U1F63_16620, partial [Chitinivorax sp.]